MLFFDCGIALKKIAACCLSAFIFTLNTFSIADIVNSIFILSFFLLTLPLVEAAFGTVVLYYYVLSLIC